MTNADDDLPTPADLDDEMKNLLDQLDRNDEYVTDQLEGTVPEEAAQPPVELAVTPADHPTGPYRQTPPAEVLAPTDVRNIDTTVQSSTEVLPAPNLPLVDLKKRFDQLEAVTEEVLQAARSDRQETQDAINLMRGEIDKAVQAGANPPRMYVDNLVKALEVKANINMTVVKIMEANSKFLAATRAGAVVQTNLQVNQGTSSRDLEDVLNENPLQSTGEDEY